MSSRRGRRRRGRSMPSMPSVPLSSARPSFSASVTGSRPAAASACGGRHAARRRASRTWPSPISARAQCASGARSPEQPSEPYSGTTGVRPALSRATIACGDLRAGRRCGRSPACGAAAASSPARPRARPAAPLPAACERTSDRWRSARRLERDVRRGQGAEAGGDPVGGLVGGGEGLDVRSGRRPSRPAPRRRVTTSASWRATATTSSGVSGVGVTTTLMGRSPCSGRQTRRSRGW